MQNYLLENFSLKGKTAIITGAGQGIGKGIALGLARAGANIVIGEKNLDTMRKAATEIKKVSQSEVLEVPLDVCNVKQIDSLIQSSIDFFESIDILVNNAGIAITKSPQELTIAEWDLNLNVNLRSVFVLSQKVYPYLKKSGGGKIINIGSMYAIFGAESLPAYAASKGGVVQLTKSLANAWASDNIQVNAIMPGWINTGLSADGKKEMPGLHEQVLERTPAGRWGEPEDLAGVAVFLASAASDFLTGVAIPVDGGYSVK